MQNLQIEALEIRNYRLFRDARLTELPSMTVVVGANGSGKSTLFDVFSFLKESLTESVAHAVARRGGFRELVSRGETGPIGITVKFRESGGRLATYQLDDPAVLAIKGLGQFKEFRVVAEFRSLIENWHISDFHISDARPSAEAGHAEHLSMRGDNVAQVAQYLFEYHPDRFDQVLEVMKQRVPGVSNVEAKPTEDGRLVLRFQDGSFKDPFIARYVSDGTITMFAYLVLLYDPRPHPLLAVEKPENQLYPELLHELVEEFRDYARRGGQVFVSTHSPDFLNGAQLDEIYWLVKEEGFTTIRRARDQEMSRNIVEEGDLPGALWKQGLFEGAGVR